MRTFADTLKKEREELGISQIELGQKLNCTRYRIADLERGKTAPTMDRTHTRKTENTSHASSHIGRRVGWNGYPYASTAATGWDRTRTPTPSTATPAMPSISTAEAGNSSRCTKSAPHSNQR